MKISNSKKQLAKIISENGGWYDGAEWYVQYGSGMVAASVNRPKYINGVWDSDFFFAVFLAEKITNWHQTVLARDEYSHLYPAPDADGWIEWKGGECPVAGLSVVDVKYFDVEGFVTGIALDFVWGPKTNIVYYRKTERAEASTRTIIEPEPTIEQLAADYRAKLAISQQAQEVADSHRCDAESALDKLVAKGKELGLVIGIPTTEHHEPELEITNRSQLELGDVIWIGRSGNPPDNDKLPEGEYQVVKVGTIGILHNGKTHYPDFTFRSWRFIRRP